ncbi:c-type cytochrome [Roseivirga sp.]|uniref:c-type cytochrome n=1 Tax=Roseivirga sp. TaxID=1964215 RepID=UPI003B51E26A
MKKSAIILAAFLIFYGCSDSGKNNKIDEAQITAPSNTVEELTVKAGLEMLQTNCYACHNPNTTSHDEMLAPPLAGIKNRYKNAHTSREEFIAAMSDFISMPTEEKALMKGPINRFGLMPKPPLSKKEDIEALVSFIYDNPIETPEWFAEHYKEQYGEEWKEQ